MSNILTGAEFGFEFTFCTTPENPAGNWTEKIKLANERTGTESIPLDKYDEFVTKFILHFQNNLPYGINSITKKDETGRFNEKCMKIEFDNDFWLQTSLDPGVIEIQTKPITYNEITNSPTIDILTCMFDFFSDTNGYKIGDGGGHINVDYNTGFDEDFELIKKTILATELLYEEIKGRWGEIVDTENEEMDPFISTDRLQLEHPEIIKQCLTDGGVIYKPQNYHDGPNNRFNYWNKTIYKKYEESHLFAQKHAIWLCLHPTLSQNDYKNTGLFNLPFDISKDNVASILHFQAINIAHIFEAPNETGDPRRLEFRFFKAQRGVDDITAGINLINEIVTHAERL